MTAFAPHLADTPVLNTARLTLRAPAARDWPHWRAMMASPRAAFIGGPQDERMAWRSFGHVIGHWVMRGFGMFVLCRRDSDTPLGMAGPWFPASWPEPEIGWNLWQEAAEGKGFAFEAAEAARDFAFARLGWTTCVSYIAPDNTRSIALARRLGAEPDETAAWPGEDRLTVWRHSNGGPA